MWLQAQLHVVVVTEHHWIHQMEEESDPPKALFYRPRSAPPSHSRFYITEWTGIAPTLVEHCYV